MFYKLLSILKLCSNDPDNYPNNYCQCKEGYTLSDCSMPVF